MGSLSPSSRIDSSLNSTGFDYSLLSGPVCSTPVQDNINLQNSSRQAQLGQKIRRHNNKVKATEMSHLKVILEKCIEENDAKDISINEITNELRKKSQENKELKVKLKQCDEWLKPTFKNMSPAARTEFKTAVQMAKHDFPKKGLRYFYSYKYVLWMQFKSVTFLMMFLIHSSADTGRIILSNLK